MEVDRRYPAGQASAQTPFGRYAPSDLHYDERGLIPAIIQVASTGEVVMLGYMNEETVRRTLEVGARYLRHTVDALLH